ncbi:MAG: hypothetical protein DCC57_04500 [Chloroflexi bacterium]|nr:MAG: hypothetical protein DCC57_04500 [Chloroflexota bacterium]
MKVIRTFDSVGDLAERFGGEVFQEIAGEALYVYHKTDNHWYHYRWVSGRREIVLVGQHSGELPLVVQVYP